MKLEDINQKLISIEADAQDRNIELSKGLPWCNISHHVI